jgi:hypothetical protein
MRRFHRVSSNSSLSSVSLSAILQCGNHQAWIAGRVESDSPVISKLGVKLDQPAPARDRAGQRKSATITP